MGLWDWHFIWLQSKNVQPGVARQLGNYFSHRTRLSKARRSQGSVVWLRDCIRDPPPFVFLLFHRLHVAGSSCSGNDCCRSSEGSAAVAHVSIRKA